jgi:Na+-transporting methylmalonyl-CoA/oxaloacetate decarboxylase gamma subunit
MAILKFLFFLLVAVWFVSLILRATFNRFLRKNAEAYNRAAKEAQRQAQRQARSKREGDVTVEASRGAVSKRVNRGVGEYVEFEEVTAAEEEKGTKKR